MFMPREQNAEQKHAVELSDKSYESGAKLKLLGKPITNQNCAHEECKRRLTSGMPAAFDSEFLVLQFTIKKIYKVQDVPNYNLVCHFMCVSNLASHVKK
jgi:hypothetical protein